MWKTIFVDKNQYSIVKIGLRSICYEIKGFFDFYLSLVDPTMLACMKMSPLFSNLNFFVKQRKCLSLHLKQLFKQKSKKSGS